MPTPVTLNSKMALNPLCVKLDRGREESHFCTNSQNVESSFCNISVREFTFLHFLSISPVHSGSANPLKHTLLM